jgi:hypothetical protein
MALVLSGALRPSGHGADRARNEPRPWRSARPQVVEMLEALRLYEILGIMATEGVEAAMSLEADMFPDNGGAPWALEANRIHGADRMIALFEEAFPLDLMSEADVAQVTAFFTAEPGIAHRRRRGRGAARVPRAGGRGAGQ